MYKMTEQHEKCLLIFHRIKIKSLLFRRKIKCFSLPPSSTHFLPFSVGLSSKKRQRRWDNHIYRSDGVQTLTCLSIYVSSVVAYLIQTYLYKAMLICRYMEVKKFPVSISKRLDIRFYCEHRRRKFIVMPCTSPWHHITNEEHSHVHILQIL